MSEKLPLRDEEPTLGLIRELRDAAVLDEALLQRVLSARRPRHARRIDAVTAEPSWDDLQIITAQLATKPRFESVLVDTGLVLGPDRPSSQALANPLFVQLSPMAGVPFVHLRVDGLGLQILSTASSHDADGAQAICINRDDIAAHRALLRSSPIPVGVRMNGAQIERDLAEALELGADFAVLDAGSGAIRALSQATSYLKQSGKSGRLTLIIAGELSLPHDFIKALALGADGIVVASSVVAAISKLVTPELTALSLLSNFIANATTLMRTMARACGHERLTQFSPDDLTTWLYDVAVASGVSYSGQTLAG